MGTDRTSLGASPGEGGCPPERPQAVNQLVIDGSQGEGGGQILRTALALSVITGTPVRIERIRAGRAKPGLQRQHLVAVRAAARVGNAALAGDELSSRELTFTPQVVSAGAYRFDIGSAGSTSLVLQTVLPPLLLAGAPSRVVVTGGTHNPLAPPFEFLRDAFCPMLARMGATVTVRLERHGFYPAGGGCLVADIQPLTDASPLHVPERGKFLRRRAVATIADLPAHVAEREAQVIRHKLKWSHDEVDEAEVEADGKGNVLTLTLAYQHVTEVITRVGELRVPAEEVAAKAAAQARRYLASDAPIGEHLADQLLLPLAIGAGGCFRTGEPSEHLTTNAAIIGLFLPGAVAIAQAPQGGTLVTVAARDQAPRLGGGVAGA